MRLVTIWAATLIGVYVAMIAYWHKAFMNMIAEAKGADLALFLVIGVVSASVGVGVVACADRLMGKKLSKVIFILVSLLMGLVTLYIVAHKLTEIVTAT
jgi:hypothetical protein